MSTSNPPDDPRQDPRQDPWARPPETSGGTAEQPPVPPAPDSPPHSSPHAPTTGGTYQQNQFGPPHGQAPGQAGQVPSYGSQPAYGYGYGAAGPARNGMGTTALVCGIIALIAGLGGFLVLTALMGIILGIVAIVTGIVGRGRARRGEATNGGAALAGIILGALAAVISIAWLVFVVFIISQVDDCATLPTQAEQEACVVDRLQNN